MTQLKLARRGAAAIPRWIPGISLALILLGGCTEPHPQPVVAAVPVLEARLAVSDTLPAVGSTVLVSVRLAGSNRDRIASFTDRIAYDTTALRFVDEVAINDGATRVSNPAGGVVRAAGITTEGFGDGPLSSFHFVVLRADGLQALRVTFDELHDLAHTDALTKLTVSKSLGDSAVMRPRVIGLAVAWIAVVGCHRSHPAPVAATRTAPSTPAPSAAPAPRIESIRPDSVRVPRGSVVEVVIRGRGFAPGTPGTNTIRFAGAAFTHVPANAAGTEVRFVIPDAIPSGGEAPPMPLESGSYPLEIDTAAGKSNIMTLRVFRQ